MNFLDIAKKRYSVRSYNSQNVEPEKLDKILEAAHIAPTAANLQPVRLLVIQEKTELDKISKAANIYNAPSLFAATILSHGKDLLIINRQQT